MQKQILVVEDNELNRGILCGILSDSYRVLAAANGQEALDILHQQKDSIDLIMLDVMMPVMDGYTFLDIIKNDTELSAIPVIVTTQSNDEEHEVAALSHGATDFVPKPYRPKVILHRVASLIKLRETAAMVNQFQYDRLTGLYSREYFYHKARELLDTDAEHEYTLVCSDIENFKLYNDTYGREAGDRVLQEGARTVKKYLGEDIICGRYGADCFLCLMEREKARSIRERFLAERNPEQFERIENITIKWGIYEIRNRSIPVERMCDRVLLAVNSIKGQYNQPFAIYDDTLRSKLLREKAITDAMENALDENQFVVYFQPKYSLNDYRIAGAEALVRWNHPELGFISPGEFIPLFEKNGFIYKLDQYVWEQVCVQLRDWMDKGYELLPVSVNVSRADVYQGQMIETLLVLIHKYGIDPKYLHLEITESAYAEKTDQIISTVEELRRHGFIFEMDDFGSGYSSLNILSQMSLDILKLDMKFIQSEIDKPSNQSILNDVVSMAHRLNLIVIDEGVETEAQVQRLRAVGCDYVQGYYFAKPMPADEFEELWRSQTAHSAGDASRKPQMDEGMPELLIIEEDTEYMKMLSQTFAGQYKIIEAFDAKKALNYIRSGEASCASAIILSMTLPENSSAEVLKELRQKPMYLSIPIIASIPDGGSLNALPISMEADDFYCKGHPIAVLQRRLQRLIDCAASHKRVNTLQDEANRDQLTGLLNRRGYRIALNALKKDDYPLALYLFDLDNLKKVNDTSGHTTGDQMISTFADLLRRSTRNGDILCRYGGDEFLVILKRMKEADTAVRKGEDVCRAFHNCFNEVWNASCSVGVTMCDTNETFTACIERADQALYSVKQSGKGQCCLWSEECAL